MTGVVRPTGGLVGFSMSSSETTDPEPASSTTASGGSVFERVAWDDPEVCNGCFARFRVLTTFADDRRHTTTDVTPAGTYDYTVEERGDSPALRTHEPRSTCAECGNVNGLAATADLSRREALARVPELADRVREAGFDVDERAMRAHVHEVKSRPDLQGRDREMFDHAVRVGIGFA
jgi:hypothetical protein